MKKKKYIFAAAFPFVLILAGAGFYFSKKYSVPIARKDNLQSRIGEKAEKAELALPEKIMLEVPFTSQAPLGNWQDVREQNGCEEASLLMVMAWARGESISPEAAAREIQNMSDYHLEAHGHFHDLSNADTLHLLNEYFKYFKARLVEDIGTEDIKKELAAGKPVIVPINGATIGNPNYEPPGPTNHKIVIIGYDDAAQEFVTHDPGTSRGKSYRYGYEVLEKSLEDYPTGLHEKFPERKTSMIVVEK